MKNLIFILSIILAFSACTSDDVASIEGPVQQPFVPVNITPVIIAEGNAIRGVTPMNGILNLVITNDADWQAFLALQMTPSNQTDFNTTTVDFTQFQVLAVFDEQKPDNGFYIDVINVVETAGEITVTVESTRGFGAFPAFTRPYQVVRIPVSTKPIVFVNI